MTPRLLRAPDRHRLVYISPDGVRFHLGGPHAGNRDVWLLGKSGELGPDPEHFTIAPARGHGVSHQGSRLPHHRLDFGVLVHAPKGDRYVMAESAWLTAWQRDREGWWCVQRPGRGWWWLGVRRLTAPKPMISSATPAVERGAEHFEMSGLVTDPLWRTHPRVFTRFAPGSGSAFVPMLRRICNPGFVDAWPIFEFQGPGVWRIRDGEHGYVVFPELNPGEQLFVDTNPGRWAVRSSVRGDVWNLMMGQRWRTSLQPGEELELELGLKDGDAGTPAKIIIEPRAEMLP